jgi:NAD(P)-dependent dehydrogenase (short-subunit alcohol dehydrogenase family)
MDPIEARRTLMGAPIVHGLHLVLLALEAVGGRLHRAMKLASLYARFPNPVMIGDEVEWRLRETDGARWRLQGSVQSDPVLDLRIEFAPQSENEEPIVPLLEEVPLHDLGFSELSGTAGSLQVGIDPLLAGKLFPCVAANFGLPVLAELLALTRLVGMRCPGRHSLLSQFDIAFDPSAAAGALHFQVNDVDERFSRITMRVEGGTLRGTLVAFYRPPPQPQPRMADIVKMVRRDEFQKSVALVVGGSRGLGETTAKLLAAGGARVIISYHRGKQDAARVAAEIQSYGGRCECRHLDVLNPDTTIQQIFAAAVTPRTLYYFATPRISVRRRSFFSPDLLQNFLQYYVVGFSKLVDAAMARSTTKLRVFFPSTAGVGQSTREIAEYSMAKHMAEELCALYNLLSENVEITIERLPRIRTDQTATLMEAPAEESSEAMLPIVRRVEVGADDFSPPQDGPAGE